LNDAHQRLALTNSEERRFDVKNNPTPQWQPLAALPLIASLIDGKLADGQEHHATLLSVRDRPYVLGTYLRGYLKFIYFDTISKQQTIFSLFFLFSLFYQAS